MHLDLSRWAARLTGSAFRRYPYLSTLRACVAVDRLFRLSLLLVAVGPLVWLLADLAGIDNPPLYIIVTLLLMDRILDRLLGYGRADLRPYETLFQAVVRDELERADIEPDEYFHRIMQPNREAGDWAAWRNSLNRFHAELAGERAFDFSDAVGAAQVLGVLLVAFGLLFVLLLAWALLRPVWVSFSGLHVAARAVLVVAGWLGLSAFVGLGVAVPGAQWLERNRG